MHETHIGTWLVVRGRYYYQIHFTNEATGVNSLWQAPGHTSIRGDLDTCGLTPKSNLASRTANDTQSLCSILALNSKAYEKIVIITDSVP